jgi:hypothetical protein
MNYKIKIEKIYNHHNDLESDKWVSGYNESIPSFTDIEEEALLVDENELSVKIIDVHKNSPYYPSFYQS